MSARRGSGLPPTDVDDPLLRPASNEGWDETPASRATVVADADTRGVRGAPTEAAAATPSVERSTSKHPRVSGASAEGPRVSGASAEGPRVSGASAEGPSAEGASAEGPSAEGPSELGQGESRANAMTEAGLNVEAPAGSSDAGEDAARVDGAIGAALDAANGESANVDRAHLSTAASSEGRAASSEHAAGAAAHAAAGTDTQRDATPTATPTTDSATTDEPLLPRRYDEGALHEAVGIAPRRRSRPLTLDGDTGDGTEGARSRRGLAVVIVGALVGVAIAGTAMIGRANRERYLLVCEAERAVPHQGRAFPPWGTRAMEGDAWRPLKIAAETRCESRETDAESVLERWFLAMLLERATTQLTAPEVKPDEPEALLKQALLLTRPVFGEPVALASERTERHAELERMLGDVSYWRAAAKLRDASAALIDAAKQFDGAAAQRPKHASDAGAWASYARRLAAELERGPGGAASSMPSSAMASGVGAGSASKAAGAVGSGSAPGGERKLNAQGVASNGPASREPVGAGSSSASGGKGTSTNPSGVGPAATAGASAAGFATAGASAAGVAAAGAATGSSAPPGSKVVGDQSKLGSTAGAGSDAAGPSAPSATTETAGGASAETRVPAPFGSALPVDSEHPTARGEGSAADAPAAPSPPSGGVLL